MEPSPARLTSTFDPAALLIAAVEEYAIFMLDRDGMVATWNSGAHRIKGYAAEEIIGRPFSMFYTPDDILDDKPSRELAAAAEHGSCRDEGWRVRKDGSRFWANVLITAVHDADGRLVGFAKVTRDETDRREAAEREKQLDLLAERDRIALELADTVVHQIFAAGLTLQTAVRLVEDPAAVTRIHDAIDTLDDTLRQIRTVIVNLDNGPTIQPEHTCSARR